MSKSSKRSKRSCGPVDRSATVDVVTQLEIAIRTPPAAAIGALLGGLVPWFGRTLAHGEVQGAWVAGNRLLALAMGVVVLGCAVFSGLSVYKFGRAAFGDPRKALGFVIALEGVMLVAHGVTSMVALTVLVLINAVSNGSVIALARDATRRKQEADARGALTRATKRAGAQEVCAGRSLPTRKSSLPTRKSSRGPVSQEATTSTVVTPVRWQRATLGDPAARTAPMVDPKSISAN